jgi:hypothetical protein
MANGPHNRSDIPLSHEPPYPAREAGASADVILDECGSPSCDSTCRANLPPPAAPGPSAWDVARERWDALRREYHRQLRGDGPHPWEMPEPLEGELLRRLVWTLLSPAHRPLLRELLLDLLGESIDERMRRVMADDLPDAVAYLAGRERR